MTHLGLGKLVIVMREHQINTTRVDIHPLAEDITSHDGTFYMPSWAAFSPTPGLPCWLSRLGFCFPKCKIRGLSLSLGSSQRTYQSQRQLHYTG